MRARPMNKVDEVVAEYLFRVAKRRAVLRRAQQGAKESASIDVYDAWCRQSLEAEFTWLFDPRSVVRVSRGLHRVWASPGKSDDLLLHLANSGR
jgi:hypothetical protein